MPQCWKSRVAAHYYVFALEYEGQILDQWSRDKCAGPDWVSEMLSIKTPEATSLSRAILFNRNNIDRFVGQRKTVPERD